MAGLLGLPAFAGAASAQQFFAEQEMGGGVRVTNALGVDVPMVDGDPIGTRPQTCPADSFYFNNLDTDKAQLVLTDCATGQGTFEVEVVG